MRLKEFNPPIFDRSQQDHKKVVTRAVHQLTMDGEFIKEFPKIITASIETGINQGDICSCCRGKYKSAGGFKWKYTNKYIKIRKSKVNTHVMDFDDDF